MRRLELRGQVHHVRLDLTTVAQVEGSLLGAVRVELLGPVTLEVNGIDQDQSRIKKNLS